MRIQLSLLSLGLVVGASACAGRASTTTLTATTFSCARHVRYENKQLLIDGVAHAPAFRDGAGVHFRPDSSRTEYVIPDDLRADAIEIVYDGSSRRSTRCPGTRGYSDALARFASGKSFEEVAQELALVDKDEARAFVNHALQPLITRYYKDR